MNELQDFAVYCFILQQSQVFNIQLLTKLINQIDESGLVC